MTPRWRVVAHHEGQRWEVVSPECGQPGVWDHSRCAIFTDRVAALDYAHARAAEDAVVLPVPSEVP